MVDLLLGEKHPGGCVRKRTCGRGLQIIDIVI